MIAIEHQMLRRTPLTQSFATLLGLAVMLGLAASRPIAAVAQQTSEKPSAIGHKQLDGVLTCTLDAPELSGDPQVDRRRREDYERRPDRIVRMAMTDEGRGAVVSAPLAPRSVPFNVVFVANRNVFNLFIEQNPISSSVYAVSRGVPEAGILGEMVHMSAASGGFARHYECSWVPREVR
jgi:hypothetical protein